VSLLSFAAVCAATAYCCTVVKEDGIDRVTSGTLRLFLVLSFGIAAFGGIIEVFTLLAG
jgi:hypothetical protein